MSNYSTLEEISSDYERTEITIICIYDRNQNKYINIYSVAEMCPVEQGKSTEILSKSGDRIYQNIRKKLNFNYDICATRYFSDNPKDSINFFRGNKNIRRVYLEKPFDLHSIGNLINEPQNEIPIILEKHYSYTSLDKVLPDRQSSFRLCTFIDLEQNTVKLFSEDELKIIGNFSEDIIGVNISQYKEFFGSIILCFSNPYLRFLKESLSCSNDYIVIELFERKKKSIKGCFIEVSDERKFGKSFIIKEKINKTKFILDIPCSPEFIRTCIYNKKGELIENQKFNFISKISIGLNISSSKRKISLLDEEGNIKGVKNIDIKTKERDINIGESNISFDTIARNEEYKRDLDSLEKSKKFVFFPGDKGDKQKARGILKELFESVSDRCIICDPYFSEKDLDYILFTTYSQIPVKIISSVMYLRKKLKEDDIQTNAEKLLERINELNKNDTNLKISCRLLRGKSKSPLHDRFIVFDNKVYMLGSSLNEFGSRATTLFLSPNPDILIQTSENWWHDNNKTISLSDFIIEDEKDE